MKISSSILILATASTTVNAAAFVPSSSTTTTTSRSSQIIVKGYLDDLNNALYKEDDTPDEYADSREANQMSKDQIDRYGPGSMNEFVDFEEFDGGDGQMGVAG